MILILATVFVLIGIIYEDLKYRFVRLTYYMALLGLLVIQRLQDVVLEQFFIFTGMNIVYILFLLASCLLYIYSKYKSVSLLKNYLGVGDVLFLIAIATWFEPVVFFLFNSISFLIALLAGRLFENRINDCVSIPLAGVQSICFLPLFIYHAK